MVSYRSKLICAALQVVNILTRGSPQIPTNLNGRCFAKLAWGPELGKTSSSLDELLEELDELELGTAGGSTSSCFLFLAEEDGLLDFCSGSSSCSRASTKPLFFLGPSVNDSGRTGIPLSRQSPQRLASKSGSSTTLAHHHSLPIWPQHFLCL